MWRAEKCNFLVSTKTAPTGTGVAPDHPSNENFRNFGATFYHGTVFAPMQSLYCKEATVVESPKLQFSSQCKNRTDLYG